MVSNSHGVRVSEVPEAHEITSEGVRGSGPMPDGVDSPQRAQTNTRYSANTSGSGSGSFFAFSLSARVGWSPLTVFAPLLSLTDGFA